LTVTGVDVRVEVVDGTGGLDLEVDEVVVEVAVVRGLSGTNDVIVEVETEVEAEGGGDDDMLISLDSLQFKILLV